MILSRCDQEQSQKHVFDSKAKVCSAPACEQIRWSCGKGGVKEKNHNLQKKKKKEKKKNNNSACHTPTGTWAVAETNDGFCGTFSPSSMGR